MNATELKAWRVSRDMSQDQAATALGIARKTLSRYEGGAPIPPKVIAKARGVENGAAPVKPAEVKAAIKAAEKGEPPPGSKEAILARLQAGQSVAGVPSDVPEVARGLKRHPSSHAQIGCDAVWDKREPLPGWQRIPGSIVVCHAGIPEPLPYHAPKWAGTRGIITASGRVYHQETGAQMRADVGADGFSAAPKPQSRPPFGSRLKVEGKAKGKR